nr:hypothetical protein [Micromonospora sp. DSM 115978]
MDEFDEVRSEPDALKRAERAGKLITIYQQRSVELARARREAIIQLAEEQGIPYVEVARLLNLTKGRITQIRQTAPLRERAFFGVGPVTIAVPERTVAGRPQPMIASEDERARNSLRSLLERLSFHVDPFDIPPTGQWQPTGDAIAICGPKSSSIIAAAIDSDPILGFGPDNRGRWKIRERATGKEYSSPLDDDLESRTDIAYIARLQSGVGSLLIIAGVHAIGSLGAVDYLSHSLAELYTAVGTNPFSMVVRSSHRGNHIVSSEEVMPPCPHR